MPGESRIWWAVAAGMGSDGIMGWLVAMAVGHVNGHGEGPCDTNSQ